MKRFGGFIISIIIGLQMVPAGTFAQASILIVEVQTASLQSSSEEFVELFNASDETIDLIGWKLQYKAATGTSWQTKAVLTGEIAGGGRYLIKTANYLTEIGGQAMSSGLAASGGHVRLIQNDELETVHDTISWGNASNPEVAAASAPAAGESIKRKVDEDGFFIDTDHNQNDWFVSSQPSPEHDVVEEDPTETPEPEPVPLPTDPPAPTPQPTGPPAQIIITELFVDPDAPLHDDTDEFVELFNAGSSSINVKDYMIQTGNNFTYSYKLPETVLEPGQYLAIYAQDSNLTLSNTEGRARILAPDGTTLFETPSYAGGKAGQSWTLLDGSWHWSDQPTPNEANIIVVGSASEKKTAKEKTASAKKTKGAKTKAAKEAKKSEDERNVYDQPAQVPNEPINKAVLAGVGSLAVLYACYEYRQDIGNRIRQLARYLKHRRAPGA